MREENVDELGGGGTDTKFVQSRGGVGLPGPSAACPVCVLWVLCEEGLSGCQHCSINKLGLHLRVVTPSSSS